MPTTDPVKSDAAGKSRTPSERTRFGWQALLILLPVGVLAVVGASFVRQDRRLVEQEARERAQAIAESLTRIIARGLASTELAFGPQSTLRRSNRSADRPWMEQPPSRGDADAPRQTFLAFQFDVEGNPVIPPRVPALEPAPLDPSRLSPGQRDLWATANRAEAEGWDPSRLFEPFFRRGSELRRETQGIGIGLSIVKHVAEAHGGSVHVESQLGQGSRFAIRLPLTTWPPDPELKPTA